MVVEFLTGFLTGSLALISDAGHMATDALGLGMALAAIALATRASRTGTRTFGLYRLEILAALANAALLFVVAAYVLYEAIHRVSEPLEIVTGPMLVVGLVGLGLNILGWWMLRDGAKESVNVEGAVLEVIADMISSVGVVLAALIVHFTGWVLIDPIIGAAIGLFILPRAYRLGKKALRVLIQAAPEDLDVDHLRQRLETIPDVTNVHDLHVWTLTSGMPVATVHLAATEAADRDAVLSSARQLLRDTYSVVHATLQIEGASEDCQEIDW